MYEFDSELVTHDYYEYEQGQKHILVNGRLKRNMNFWRDIGASDFILHSDLGQVCASPAGSTVTSVDSAFTSIEELGLPRFS